MLLGHLRSEHLKTRAMAETKVVEKVNNKQVKAKDYITGNPKETDMYLSSSIISLQLPPEASNAVLVKNLYLSCDPYMRGSRKPQKDRIFDTFVPDSVCPSISLFLSHFQFQENLVICFCFILLSLTQV